MVFNIFGLSGLEQAAFFHNLGQMKEALPLNSILSCFETTPLSLKVWRDSNPRTPKREAFFERSGKKELGACAAVPGFESPLEHHI
jgi:hypothetical protein